MLGLHPSVPTRDAEAAALRDHISVSWARLFGSFPNDAQIAMVAEHLRHAPVDAEAAIKFLASQARAAAAKAEADAKKAAEDEANRQSLAQAQAAFAQQVSQSHVDLASATFPDQGGNE